MTGMAAAARRPGPAAAYAPWLSACADAGWQQVAAVERVPVGEALGRVTAEPVHGRRYLPRSCCAAMDGIAVKAGPATCGAGPAGRWRLDASSFTWIDTGQWLPPGMDTVIECERVSFAADGTAWVTGAAPRGRTVPCGAPRSPVTGPVLPASRSGSRCPCAAIQPARAAGGFCGPLRPGGGQARSAGC
jgi:hypothetical protein